MDKYYSLYIRAMTKFEQPNIKDLIKLLQEKQQLTNASPDLKELNSILSFASQSGGGVREEIDDLIRTVLTCFKPNINTCQSLIRILYNRKQPFSTILDLMMNWSVLDSELIQMELVNVCKKSSMLFNQGSKDIVWSLIKMRQFLVRNRVNPSVKFMNELIQTLSMRNEPKKALELTLSDISSKSYHR